MTVNTPHYPKETEVQRTVFTLHTADDGKPYMYQRIMKKDGTWGCAIIVDGEAEVLEED